MLSERLPAPVAGAPPEVSVALGPSSHAFEPRGAPRVRRAALALGNVLLLAGLGLAGSRTARGGAPAADEQPPAGWSPLRFALADDAGRPPSLDAVTWLELDRPAPAPVAAPPVVAVEPPAQPALRLVMASYSAADPARSSLVVVGRDGQQRLLGVDDALDGCQVLEILVQGEGDAREAVVTLGLEGGRRDTLRLGRGTP